MNSQIAITLLKNLEQSLDDYCELNDEGKTAFSMAISALELFGNSEQLPSAQPRKGKWMPDNTNYYDERHICSECNANYKVDTCMGKPSWNFCPNCGSYNGGKKTNCGCRMEEGDAT